MSTINSTYINKASRTSASKGMRVEGEMSIWPGAVLFRFLQRADVRDADCVGSPWWFQASVIRKVLNAARDGAGAENRPALHATRKAGLSKSWARSGANYLLCAKVTAPISLYWGPPRPIGTSAGSQTVSGLCGGGDVDEIEVVPDPQCVQFFIPGMWEPKVASRAVKVLSRTKFKHSVELEQGEVEAFLRRVSVQR